jgi:hypothetical protein
MSTAAHVSAAKAPAHVSAAKAPAHVSAAGESGAKRGSPMMNSTESASGTPHRPHVMHGMGEVPHCRRSRAGRARVTRLYSGTSVLEGLNALMGLSDVMTRVILETCLTRMIDSAGSSRVVRAESLMILEGCPCRRL